MTITLYNTNSPREKVIKNLTNARNVSADIKAPIDVLHPSLVFGAIDITGYNYCYIPDFKRYYYISQLDTAYNNMSVRTCEVDVLMSYASEIQQLSGLIERQENFYNLYLPDLRIPNYAYKRVQTKYFPAQPVNVNPTFILATTGMGGS